MCKNVNCSIKLIMKCNYKDRNFLIIKAIANFDLDSLPFPDYDDFDLNLYEHPDGASIETSRGCVAKCSFCAETHFWK